MISVRSYANATVAGIVGLMLMACDGDRPSRPLSPSAPSPGLPTALRELRIGGPESIPPGGSAAFTATAVFGDGSTRDVTNQAAWRSSDDAVLSMAPTGVATAGNRGEVSITTIFESRSVVKVVMVLPAGTYRLSGVIREEGVVLGDVQVTAVGAGGSLTATTDRLTGAYRLYGVVGPVEITAAAVGYAVERKNVHVSGHQVVDFSLTPARPRDTVGGAYHLTVTAAATCTSLPPEARVRHYTAVLTQRGIQVDGTLEGAEFYVETWGKLNHFSGTVHPDRLRLRFPQPFDYIFYFPEIFEELSKSPPAYLALVGDVNTAAAAGGYSGMLDGIVEFWSSAPGGGVRRTVTCRSAEHQVVLTR